MRNRLVPVTVALLCIVALGLGAATLTSVTDGGDGGGVTLPDQTGNETGGEEGDRSTGAEPGAGGQHLIDEDDSCIAGYNQTDVTWVTLVVALGLAALVFVRHRSVMAAAITFPLVLVPLMGVMVVLFAFLGCPPPGGEMAPDAVQQNGTVESFGEALGGGDDEPTPLDSRLRLGALFLAMILGLLLLGLYANRIHSETSPDETTVSLDDQHEQLRTAAGAAADELEADVSLENAVYRAWAEMTDALDIDRPETSTPTEFADAALEAGLHPDDVSELTALFEEVRYGTAEPTAEREDRARDALRRIEQTYADVDEKNRGEKREGGQWQHSE